jgi:hypothetical protein
VINKDSDLQKLRDIEKDIWKHTPRTLSSAGWSQPTRLLTSSERKFIYRIIKEYSLPCVMFTMYNQGVGISIWEPDPSMGQMIYPGVEATKDDLKHIISIWQDHIFNDSAPIYRYREWLKKRGRNMLEFTYKFFKAIAEQSNLELLKLYGFKEPLIQPLSHFEY